MVITRFGKPGSIRQAMKLRISRPRQQHQGARDFGADTGRREGSGSYRRTWFGLQRRVQIDLKAAAIGARLKKGRCRWPPPW